MEPSKLGLSATEIPQEPLNAPLPHKSPIVNLHGPVSTSSRFRDRRIHDWYTSVMSFPDHLVESILEAFEPSEGAVFIDPHCGSGTALVEAQRKGLRAFGIDANPSSVLASRVKTDWSIDLSSVRTAIDSFNRDAYALEAPKEDPIISYLEDSGMIDRGWITDTVATQAVAIKRWIDRTIPHGQIHRFFMLALIATVVKDISNVKFGPELYCVSAPTELPDPAECMTIRLKTMVEDLESYECQETTAQVRLGDSRDGRSMRAAANWSNSPAFVVTSPPYPTEHDYTRNSRLELVFMEAVADLESLRRIKRRMIRSHSKGIYVNDRDAEFVSNFEPVQRIRREIQDRTKRRTSGFEGQYPKVVANYFGGMMRHFHTLASNLPAGSRLAYVLGDEASYKGVHIPTAQLLSEIVDSHTPRLRLDDVIVWRSRRSYKGRKPLHEHVLLMRVV